MPIDDAIDSLGSQLDQRWMTAISYCRFRQVGMSREIDGWKQVERNQGRWFGGFGFILGLATTVYAAADNTPDPTAIAVVGALGAVSSVPNFLRSGPEERTNELNARIARIATAREEVHEAAAAAMEATVSFTAACQAMRDRGVPAGDHVRAGCAVPEGYEVADDAVAVEERASLRARASDAYNSHQSALTRLSLGLDALMYACDRGT